VDTQSGPTPGGRRIPRLRRPDFSGKWTPLVSRRQSEWRLLLLAAGSAALAAIAWASTTQTLTGQQLGDTILFGRATADLALVEAANETLALVGLASAAMAALGLAALAFVRGGVGSAVATAVMIGGANVTSLVLKATLPRPDLLGASAYAPGNSFPSGTVTLVASIMLAAILIAPRRLRTPTAVVASIVTAAVGTSTIIAGWHRLGDVAGGVLIALSWSCLVTMLLVLARGWMPRHSWGGGAGGRSASVATLGGAAAILVGAAGIALVTLDRPYLSAAIADRAAQPGPFVAALSIAAGISFIACVGYVVAMRGVAIERRG
jgi:membrane-associated phospholipid phosphatase